MINLNDTSSIKKLDPQNTLDSTEKLVEQCKTAWSQVNKITIPADYSNITNITSCGMGASIYGALVAKSLFGNILPYSMEIVSDYHLPSYINSASLVILTSYSGTTEEVLSCAQEAKQKGAKMLVLTKGGQLEKFAQTYRIPAYIFDGILNPAGVPRLGNGYSILGLLGLLSKAHVISVNTEQVNNALSFLENQKERIKQKAQKDAKTYMGKIPVIFAAEHLGGNAQILRNQFNETSKAFSAYYLIPDLNHHLMEGLQFPRPSNLKFILLNSSNYSDKIKKRMQLTLDVVKKNNQKIVEFSSQGKNVYEDFLEVMVYGSYLTLYLGLLYEQNPAINPWVDYFKEQLKSS